MNDLGTCRKDDRKPVAAENQTAACIIPSLPAGSRHTAIKANVSSAQGGTIRVRTLPMGEAPVASSCTRACPRASSGLQPFHCVLVATLQGLRSTAASTLAHT